MASQLARAVLKLKPHVPLIKFRGQANQAHPAPSAAPAPAATTSPHAVVSTSTQSLFKRPLLPKEVLDIIQLGGAFP